MHSLIGLVFCMLAAVTIVASAPRGSAPGEMPLRDMTFDDTIAECADSLPEKCERHLLPHFCYNHFTRQQCCATCQKLREQSDVCPFGDQPITKWRAGRKYDCHSYVSEFGTKHCEESKKFRLQCCKSCEKARESRR